MKFWDSSAIVPLVIAEESSRALRRVAQAEPTFIVWWATPLECVSAISRRERQDELTATGARGALKLLESFREDWHEIGPAETVRRNAIRLLRVHPLRAADALQLAAAVVAAEDYAEALDLVTLDHGLADAARREGFTVLMP